MRKLFITILIGCLIYPITSFAGIYGVLKGRVVDNEGKPVIGASVLVEGTSRGTYVKDKDGKFTVSNITAGNYTVKVSAVGFEEYRSKVFINADQTSEIDVKLLPKGVKMEGITVKADKLVDKTEVGSVKSLRSDDITSTAVQSVQAVVALEAGVIGTGGGYNIRGSRSSETQIRVDGLDVGNQFTGSFGSGGLTYFPMVSAFATAEVQVLTGGFSAEYGDALGGVVNTIVKNGRNDRYEGFFRYNQDLQPLFGSQHAGVVVERDGNVAQVVESGPGKKALGNEEYTFEFGGGGPLHLLDKSTFYLTGKYLKENFRGASYEIFDPWGNNLSRMPHNGTWVRNLTGRLSFGITPEINLILGGSYGVTSWENSSLGWLYADDEGVFFDTSSTGGITRRTNGVPERMAKQNVGNQFVSNIMARINHTLTEKSFYELTVSYTTNSDEGARRLNYDDPGFLSGFELLIPKDEYTFAGFGLLPGPDKIVDYYQSITAVQDSRDGYLQDKDILQPNPFTGYIETNSNTTGTNNPWGLTGLTVTHGTQGFSFRQGGYLQIDGNYTQFFEDGDFRHAFKTGFEVRFYEMRLHSNGNPTSDEPFYDVYSDKWGGNIYAENEEIYKKTSQPYNPFRINAYVQDQIEFKGITFTPGLRLDMLNPNSDYRIPSRAFTPITADTGFAKADMKIQISPRINVTYPITLESTIRLSYGIFYKMPEMQYLYDGFAKNSLRGNDVLGNPNLEVQRTNFYEIAFAQQLTDDIALEITTYYKDVYNQLGIQYVATTPTPYYQYVVAEYGNAKGLEFELRKNPTDNIGLRLNYTLSSVVGTSTSSGDNYNPPTDPYSGNLMLPLEPYVLGYDRPHQLTAVLQFVWGKGEGPSIGGINFLENAFISFTGSYSSGGPYTRVEPGGKALSEINAERNPDRWNVNMRLSKRFMLADWWDGFSNNTSLEVFFDVFNLTNRFAPVAVYNASGDPDDDGITLRRRIGDFGSIPFYKDANFGNPETYNVTQYDSFGNRLYNENADLDRNGVVTQVEKYQSYMNYVEMVLSYRGNYSFPRQVFFGVMLNF